MANKVDVNRRGFIGLVAGGVVGANGAAAQDLQATGNLSGPQYIVTPEQFGAAGDSVFETGAGTDDTAALDAARDFCVATGTVLYLVNYYKYVGTFELADPIRIDGMGRHACGIYMDIDRESEGVHINSSDVTIENIEIAAHIPATIQNGQGTYGTCITVGTLFYPAVFSGSTLIEPDPITGIILNALKLTRANKSRSGHALAITGRSSGVRVTDIDFVGHSPAHRHGDAILIHWGTTGRDFPLREGALVRPLVLRKELDAATYHPNNIVIDDIRVRNTGRLIALSSIYNVSVTNVDFDGLDDGTDGNGVQLVDLVVGDEADRYAHADDAGKVYSNVKVAGIVCRNITGSGVNARSLIDVSGFSTSKYEDDPNTGKRYQEQPKWKNVEFSNIDMDAELSDTTELLNVRNFLGDVVFRNIHATGKVSQDGIKLQQINGRFLFENCYTNLPVLMNDCQGVSWRDCRFEGSPFPMFQVDVVDTKGYLLGEPVNDSLSRSNLGHIVAIVSPSRLLVQASENWTPYDTTQDLVGASSRTSSAITSIATASNATMEITGGTDKANLTAKLRANDTFIAVRGFAKDLKIGDKLTYSNGATVFVTRYASARSRVIEISPAPVSAATNTTFRVERRTQNIRFDNCIIEGSSRGIVAKHCYNVSFTGGVICRAGQYGMLVGIAGIVNLDGTEFQNNGLRRLTSYDDGLSTRDLVTSAKSTLNGQRLRFDESKYVEHHFVNNASAISGTLRDCMHIEAPIKDEILNSSSTFVADNNRDARGRLV